MVRLRGLLRGISFVQEIGKRIGAFSPALRERLKAKLLASRRRQPLLPITGETLEFRRLLSVTALATGGSTAAINVNAAADVHLINPNIYGAAFATTAQLSGLNLSVNREGGNNADTYNWQQDANNLDNDYYFESYPQGSGNGQSMDAFVSQTQAGGAQPDLTIPIMPYVASLGPNGTVAGSYPVSVYGQQQSTDPYYPNFGNGVTSGGQNILDTNLYNYVANSPAFEQGWIQHLLSTFGTPGNGGVQYFTLGNEPGLWNSTNKDIHPNGETNSELLNDLIAYGSMIKSIDPTAQILGPEEWGWTNYFVDGADAAAGNYGATYTGLGGQQLNAQQWLLQQLDQYQQQSGVRLLDYYTLHYYPQEGNVGSNAVDSTTELLRNQVTRALWDPTYVDPSWIGTTGINNGVVDLIPTMQSWVNQYYPGTQTGITEYNFGAEGDMNGATTQADVYGIFGQQGLDLATRWETPAIGTPTYLGMQLWRNYDGHDSGFGNTSVGATVANPDQTDAFSAIRSSDGALTVAVINKNLYSASDPTATTQVTVDLSGFASNGVAQDWQLAAINPSDQTRAAITNLANIHFIGNSFTINVPMESVTMFVIEPASSPIVTLNPTGTTVTAGQTASFTANASGTPTPTILWQVSTDGGVTFTNISGATSTTYSFTAAANQNNNEYRAVFTNADGSVNTTSATLIVNAPQIVVQNGKTTLNDGSSTVNLGTTTPGIPLTQVITVTNSGSAALTVQPVTVPTGFSVTDNFTVNQSIAVGASVSFTIQLTAAAFGTFTGTVSFAENDTTTSSPFTFTVLGIVNAPKIVVQSGSTILTNGTSTINLHSATAGTPATQMITVTNAGNTALMVQPVTVPTGFSVLHNFTTNQSIAAGSSANFTIQLNVATIGTPNGTVTIADNDTTASPFTFTVTSSVNHAPVGTSGTVTSVENSPYIFGVNDFGFTDPNDSPPNLFLAVEFTTLPLVGRLTDNGATVNAGTFISVTDITAGKLKFTPATNGSGSSYASFTLQVQDNGGTANGGIDTDPNPKTLTINISPIAPKLTAPAAVSVPENGFLAFTAANAISVTDVGATSEQLSLTVQHGSLTLGTTTGLSVTGNDSNTLSVTGSLSSLDTALGTLSYAPTVHYSGMDSLSLSNKDLSDGLTGTANVAITVGYGTASKVSFQLIGGGTASGYLSPVKVAIEDQFGNVVSGSTSIVTVSVASGPGGFANGSITSVTAVNGIATFTGLILRTNGLYTLSATSGTLIGTTSGLIVVTPGPATKLAIGDPENLAATTTVTAGTIITPTVLVEDSYGNVVNDNSSQVSLTFGGVNLGMHTVLNGVATFAAQTLTLAGTKNLNAAVISSNSTLSNAPTVALVVTPATAAQLVITQSPTAGTAGTVLGPLKVAIEDQFGNILKGSTATVTVATGNGPAALAGGSTTSVAATNGIATFNNLILNTSGIYTLQVSQGTLPSTTSANMLINPGTAAKLAFQTGTVSASAGVAFAPAITVAVEDQFGNIVAGNVSTITLLVATGPGVLAVSSTNSVKAVNGIATFTNVILNTSGTYTLGASDGALVGATSANVIINHGSAAKLSVQVSGGGTASGYLSPVKVAVEDQFGNIMTGDTSTVTLSVAAGPGAFANNSTNGVAVINGMATFSALILRTSGTYVLAANDGALSKGLSGNVVIVPGPASKLAIGDPQNLSASTNVAAGTPITPVVLVEDNFGNVVNDNSTQVSLTFAGVNLGTQTVVSGVASFPAQTLTVPTTKNINAAVISSSSTLSNASTVSIVITPAAPAKLVITQAPTTGQAGTTLGTVKVAVEDLYGNIVTGNNSSVTLSVGTGSGSFAAGSTTSVAASNGIATFTNLVLNTSGTYTLQASDGSLTAATSANLTVSPGAAAMLAFQTGPISAVAGVTLSPAVTVAVEDQFGNLVTSSTSTVTLSVANGPNGLAAGSSVSMAAVNGIATFSNLILNIAGTYILNAADGTLTSARSANVSIGHGSAAKVGFLVNGGGSASGYLSPVKVAIEDQFGNLVTGDTSTVTLAVASGPGQFANSSTNTAVAVNGIATFSALILRKSGTYTLSASDGTLGSSISGNVTITPGMANKLAIGDPQNLPASTSVTVGTVVTPTVLVEDSYGNVVNDNSTQVSFTFAGANLGTQTVVNGIATFASQTLAVLGTKNANASVVSSNSALSNAVTVAFVVTATPAAKLNLNS